MPGAKYTDTYKKVSAMGEKLKAAGKQGPSNDEQLHVRGPYSQLYSRNSSSASTGDELECLLVRLREAE